MGQEGLSVSYLDTGSPVGRLSPCVTVFLTIPALLQKQSDTMYLTSASSLMGGKMSPYHCRSNLVFKLGGGL